MTTWRILFPRFPSSVSESPILQKRAVGKCLTPMVFVTIRTAPPNLDQTTLADLLHHDHHMATIAPLDNPVAARLPILEPFLSPRGIVALSVPARRRLAKHPVVAILSAGDRRHRPDSPGAIQLMSATFPLLNTAPTCTTQGLRLTSNVSSSMTFLTTTPTAALLRPLTTAIRSKTTCTEANQFLIDPTQAKHSPA